MLKIQPFSPIFPLKGSIIGGILFGYSFEISRRLCHTWLFHLHSMVKIQLFLQFSLWRNPRLKYFAGYPFETSRKKASTIF